MAAQIDNKMCFTVMYLFDKSIKFTGGNAQFGIKDEPLSPASSHGSDSTDSMSSQVMRI